MIRHNIIRRLNVALRISPSIFFFILVAIIFSGLGTDLVFAQESFFAARDDLIFASLNQVEAKQKAMTDAMMDAQMKLAESKPSERSEGKKKSGFGLGDIASRTHPYFLLTTTFDNNLNNTRYDRKSSLINTATPGLKINFNGPSVSTKLDVLVNNKFYNNRPKSDNQNAAVNLLTNFIINRYTLAFSDSYNNYYGPADVVSSDDTSYDNTIQWSNSFATTLSRQFNRLGFNLKYNRLDYQYRGDAAFQNNYYQNTYAFQQTFSISKKTEFLFGYDYSNVRYNHDLDTSKNYFYDQYKLELTKVLTPKVTGLLSATYKDADYKDQNDYKEGIYKANLSYQPSLRTNFSFLYQHTPHDSPDKDNYTIDNNYKLSLIYRPVFSHNIQFNLSYQAQFIDYPKQEDPGDNDTYTWNFTLNYFFRQWLDFSLNYYNKRSKGNVATKYIDNVITLKTQARF